MGDFLSFLNQIGQIYFLYKIKVGAIQQNWSVVALKRSCFLMIRPTHGQFCTSQIVESRPWKLLWHKRCFCFDGWFFLLLIKVLSLCSFHFKGADADRASGSNRPTARYRSENYNHLATAVGSISPSSCSYPTSPHTSKSHCTKVTKSTTSH